MIRHIFSTHLSRAPSYQIVLDVALVRTVLYFWPTLYFEFVWDFSHIAPVRNKSDSGTNAVRNRGQISHFL